jgi:hypothetical protein
MIVMTKAQANQVRGHHVDGHALAPRPFKNDNSVPSKFKGRFALPEEVLTNPFYQHLWNQMSNWATVPDTDINQGVWDPLTKAWTTEPDWETDPALLAPHEYSGDWPVGQIIVVP